jgi:hypothetical protein
LHLICREVWRRREEHTDKSGAVRTTRSPVD